MISTVGLVLLATLLGLGAAAIPDDMFGGELAVGEAEQSERRDKVRHRLGSPHTFYKIVKPQDVVQ